jgi:3-(3-hydroxy-phenyl)propionate hydroxylase
VAALVPSGTVTLVVLVIVPSGERAVFDLAVLKGETDHPFRLQCEQSKYCQILHAALASFPCVSIRFSTTVKSLQQTAETVRIQATSLNGEQEYFAHYVIGADGARSAVRRDLGIEMSGDVYPETTILATTRFPFHEKLDGLSHVNYCWKPEGTFSLLRLPDVSRA